MSAQLLSQLTAFLMRAEGTAAGLDVPMRPRRGLQVGQVRRRPAVTKAYVNIFFYGLFMDMGVLQQRGLAPRHPQVARLDGYDLDIRVGGPLLALASTPKR